MIPSNSRRQSHQNQDRRGHQDGPDSRNKNSRQENDAVQDLSGDETGDEGQVSGSSLCTSRFCATSPTTYSAERTTNLSVRDGRAKSSRCGSRESVFAIRGGPRRPVHTCIYLARHRAARHDARALNSNSPGRQLALRVALFLRSQTSPLPSSLPFRPL